MNFYYSYDNGLESIAGTAATTVLAAYSVFMSVWALCWIAGYILKGFGLYTIAKNQGDENAWMAFVPFARKYQQGELAGDIVLKKKSIKKTGIIFLVLPVAWGIVSYLIGMIFGISVTGKLIKYGIFAAQGHTSFDVEDILEGLIGFVIVYAVLMLVYQAVYKVLRILVDMQILNNYTEGNMPVVHGVLCALVPLYESICFFVISRKIDGETKEEAEVYQEVPENTSKNASDGIETPYGNCVPRRGLLNNETVEQASESCPDTQGESLVEGSANEEHDVIVEDKESEN